MTYKKTFLVLLSVLILVSIFTSCQGKDESDIKIEKDKTFFYYYQESLEHYAILGVRKDSYTELSIPATFKGKPVKEISYEAFKNCQKLEKITLSDNLVYINAYAFSNCPNLSYTTYGNAKYLGTEDNPYYALIRPTDENITTCTVHSQTKVISAFAFSGEVETSGGLNIKTQIIDENGQYIDLPENPYKACQSLTEVIFEENSALTYINTEAFSNTSITFISLPKSVKDIGSGAFLSSNLFKIVLHNNITDIGKDALYTKYVNYGLLESCPIYYFGTAEEWSAVHIDDQKADLITAHCYFYSENQPTEQGNYWRYVDNVPTAWE